jgi:hypothetical protein
MVVALYLLGTLAILSQRRNTWFAEQQSTRYLSRILITIWFLPIILPVLALIAWAAAHSAETSAYTIDSEGRTSVTILPDKLFHDKR